MNENRVEPRKWAIPSDTWMKTFPRCPPLGSLCQFLGSLWDWKALFNFKPKIYSITLTTKSESGSHARQIKSLIKHKKSNGSLHWIFRPWKQNLSSACEGVYPTLLMKKLFKKVNILFHKDLYIYRGSLLNCSSIKLKLFILIIALNVRIGDIQ